MAEATSRPVTEYVSALERDELATSSWARAEFGSLLGIRVRSRWLEQVDAKRAQQSFEEFLGSFTVLDATPVDFELASIMLRKYRLGLRAGDALHLAIARNQGSRQVLSLDKALLRAGRFFSIDATTGTPIAGYDS